MKGERERIIVLAHQTEAMARQKVLKPLPHYLKPPKPKQSGNSAVIAMMRRIKARQDKKE
jgi:hypothetical protein